MSASGIISASLPSFCRKVSKLVKIDEVLTKTILHSFLRHCVEYNYGQDESAISEPRLSNGFRALSV